MLRLPKIVRALSLSAIASLISISLCSAHDIPGKATLFVFVKPEETRLQVLVRVPLEAMSEVKFPLRGPGYLDIATADRALIDGVHTYLLDGIRFHADGAALPHAQILKTRVSLPGDKALTDFAGAFASIDRARLADTEEIYWKQAVLDVLLSYPLPPGAEKLALDADLARIAMETHTVLRYVNRSGKERVLTYQGNPGRIELEPGWWYATSQFMKLGFWHILDGIDHLLFLLCLVIPTRSVRALVPAITAFTIAHSLTLISSALGLIPTATWFGPLIEMLIALSVCYMAVENILGIRVRSRWIIVFAFGLIHGFGFSFILADRMQFAGDHLLSGLVAFNIGVELGQLLVLIVAVPLFNLLVARLAALPKLEVDGERFAVILISVLVAHTAWHWLVERSDQLLAFSVQTPVFDAAFFAAALRWAMLLLASVGVLWAMKEVLDWLSRRKSSNPSG